MKHSIKRWLAGLLVCLLLLPVCPVKAEGAAHAFQEGNNVAGFVVRENTRLDLLDADVTLLEHEKTGALVMLLQNEDINRSFDISFRTPTVDDTGIPHVFEHSTLKGSMKYPSQSLFLNLIHQTYNTYMNAMTFDVMTTYPVSSLSEMQLLKYADYYTDSVLNPLLMQEESIFREEAWRYTLPTLDEELTLSGTVYTEMQGVYTIDVASEFNLNKTLFPGSRKGNSHGGHPQHIPELSWDDLKVYHDAYYHPSNSLTVLYGKLENPEAFLELLDGYFSAFEKREFSFEDPGYTPLTAPVSVVFDFPVESDSDTTKGAVVGFGYALGEMSEEDDKVLQLLAILLNEDSSPFQQAMKEKLPSATASCSYSGAKPEAALAFSAQGMAEEDAGTFQTLIEDALQLIAENGFDQEAVEGVAAANRLNLLLSTESSNVGATIASDIAYHWANSGDTNAYSNFVDNNANFVPFAQDGSYQRVIGDYLLENTRTALVITRPMPGLKEQQEQALREELAARKAAMTQEELQALVDATNAHGEDNQDSAEQYVKQLQAVDVASLPVENRMYAITDEQGEDGVRRMHAQASVSQVGQAMLLLPTHAIEQEDLHWYKLYTDLLGKLDTQQYDNAQLRTLITRYFYGLELRPTVFVGPDSKGFDPYLYFGWVALDEDMQPGYDLAFELLFNTRLDDAQKIMDVVGQIKTSLRQSLNNSVFQVQILRAFGSAFRGLNYSTYLNHLDYYAFLEETEKLLEENPEEALERLQTMQAFFKVRNGVVSAFAGSEESSLVHREAADAFLNRLEEKQRENAEYQLPEPASSEAIVVDAAVQYNLLYASNETLGLEESNGELNAVTLLVSDAFLYPDLREQYGAYSVMHSASDQGVYILTIRDPNVEKTFEVFASLPERIEGMDLDQETLDGYILAAYSALALPKGELAGAWSALWNTIDNQSQERVLTRMRQLKELTVDKVNAFGDLYRTLNEKGYVSTGGGAKVIEENEALYEKVFNPFAVKDSSDAVYTDVGQGAWYDEAVQYVLDKKVMQPLSDTAFGADEPATVGDFADALAGLTGVFQETDQNITLLAQAQIIEADAQAEDPMTRAEMAGMMTRFLTNAAGMDVQTGLQPLPEAADVEDVPAELKVSMQFALGNGLMLQVEDKIAPLAPATRAELAYLMWGLDTME
ncbi:MAG: insulinase family protein [Bacillota bacterium]|nr:insulinase family protein [Bacillota bacterium]